MWTGNVRGQLLKRTFKYGQKVFQGTCVFYKRINIFVLVKVKTSES